MPDPTRQSWSDKFNALPIEVRRIGAAQEAFTRIQMLGFEKQRLKRLYEASMREIDEHIESCRDGIRRLEGGDHA